VGAAAGRGGGIVERGILLRLRFELDLYVNHRPFVAAPDARHPDIDLVVIRENTEGVYAGEGGFLRKGTPHEVATQGSVNTRMGVERCIRYAFELARSRPRKHLTLVHKTNVLTHAGGLWARTFAAVAAEFSDVTTEYQHIDAASMFMVSNPQRYDVVVTDNLFGDILTDIAAAVTGGIGMAASGSVNPERKYPSTFEPVHGSAPDIAGQGIADPAAAILSASLLLEHLGHDDEARRVSQAVAAEVASRIPGAPLRTAEVGDRVASAA
jgi:3-isopropylmalate dehydrogenase